MIDLYNELEKYKEEKYGDFIASLTPNVDRCKFIGVRVPVLRTFAKDFIKNDKCEEFIKTLPHKYYEENLLHSILLSKEKDLEKLYDEIEEFLPFIDNWAVCDTLTPILFKKHKNKDNLTEYIRKWIDSDEDFIIRFGVNTLMTYYLDEDFNKEYLSWPVKLKSDGYYVKMMVAWYYATALAKQWDDAIVYIEDKRLDKWTHNKAIQKAIESYRITDNQKEYLRSLKIK